MFKHSSRELFFACIRFRGGQNWFWQIINKLIHPILVVFSDLVTTVIDEILFYFGSSRISVGEMEAEIGV